MAESIESSRILEEMLSLKVTESCAGLKIAEIKRCEESIIIVKQICVDVRVDLKKINRPIVIAG